MGIHRRDLLTALARGVAGAAAVACFGAAAARSTAAAAAAGLLQPATIRYAVLRDGAEIGSRTLEFRPEGDRLVVRTAFRIDVRILGIAVYRFRQTIEEAWADERLERLTTETDDDGERHRLVLHHDGRFLSGTYDDVPLSHAGDLLPASFWNEAITGETRLIDPMAGALLKVTVRRQGIQDIDLAGEQVTTRHFRMRGDLERDMWYGPDGQLVQIGFEGRDGTPITIRRRSLQS